MLQISKSIAIADDEIGIAAIRAQGAGGQNVNKVASAVHLRFDIRASSLPDFCKERLLAVSDRRLTLDGEIIIKAQRYRSFEKNRADALERLRQIIGAVVRPVKTRKATKPSRSSREKRLEDKQKTGRAKSLRRKVSE